MMKEKLWEVLFRSLSYGLVLSVLAFFLGWIRYSPVDPSVTLLPVPLQVVRMFVIGFVTSFVLDYVFYFLQTAVKKRKNKK